MARGKSKKETLLKPDKSAKSIVQEPVAEHEPEENHKEVSPHDLLAQRASFAEPPAAIPQEFLNARQLGVEDSQPLEFSPATVRETSPPLELSRPVIPVAPNPIAPIAREVVPEVIPSDEYTVVRAPLGMFDTSPSVTMFRNLESVNNRKWAIGYNELLAAGYKIENFSVNPTEIVFLFRKK